MAKHIHIHVSRDSKGTKDARYTARNTSGDKFMVFENGKATAVAGPFTQEEAARWIREHATKDATPFETIYAQYEDLNRKVKEASVKLQAFPKGSMGLTPDDVKKSPAYRQAMNEFNLYNEKSKALASFLMKNFKTEMKNRPRSYTRAGDGASVAISPSLQKQIGSVGSAHREEMPANVFLEPASRKYPVKEKEGGEWKWSRKLLLAAAREARMHGDELLAKRADEIRAREFGADI